VTTSTPLRILHLDSGREWRGGQRQVYLLARGQRELGHEPLVIGAPDAPLIRRLRSDGIAAAEVGMRGDWDIAAASRVRTALRTWNGDLIHAHDAHAHAIALAALIGRRSVPLIVTRRVVFVPHGRLKYGHRVSRFIAVSGAVREALKRGGVDGSRIELVYDGVNQPRVVGRRDWRAECGWPSDSVVCGIVGAMSPEKGLAMLSAIRDQLQEPSRSRIRLVLLGGKRECAQSIGGLTASSAEGLGTAVIDAVALGVPPVAFRVGGLPEVIEDQRCGLLVPAGDVAGFAAAIDRLVRDEDLRRLLGAAGPERAAKFSVERMVLGTQGAYDTVLAEGSEPRRWAM
jgi:L-malate glycosyltransferase